MAILIAAAAARAQTVIYVKASAPAGGNGQSWGTAYNDLQLGLDRARLLNPTTTVELWLAQGTYRPTVRNPISAGPGFETFLLDWNDGGWGLKIRGGFVGYETNAGQRSIPPAYSVISGDLAGDDLPGRQNSAENAFNAVTVTVNSNLYLTLDGLLINGGRNYGVHCAGIAAVSVVDCAFVNNSTGLSGGTFSMNMDRSRFVGNATGLVLNSGSASGPAFRNCLFAHNGEGAYFAPASGGVGNFTQSTFAGNSTNQVYVPAGPPDLLSGCLLAGPQTNSIPGCSVCNRSYPDITGLFVDPDGADNIPGTIDDDFRLAPTSSGVIDYYTACNIFAACVVPSIRDLGGYRRQWPVSGLFDAGCYEFGAPPYQRRLYVNGGLTSGAGDGLTWASALRGSNALQNSLAAVQASNGEIVELWVAAGTYKPAAPGGSRSATFQLQNNLAIYGGFGGTETQFSQRDITANPTILSGDLNGDDNGSINLSDNAYHVLTASGVGNSAALDGFTVIAGTATSSTPPNDGGGGLYALRGSPQVRNCVFQGNVAAYGGGAIGFAGACAPAFFDCQIIGNRVTGNPGPGIGGGVYASGNPGDQPVVELRRCVISANQAIDSGGGAAAYQWATVLLLECTLERNTVTSAGGYGGAVISKDNSTVRAFNCRMSGNTSAYRGGAAIAFNSSNLDLVGCVLSGNQSGDNGAAAGMYDSVFGMDNSSVVGNAGGDNGAVVIVNSTGTIENSLIWENSRSGTVDELAQYATANSSLMFSYSSIQHWSGGLSNGNNSSNPAFLRLPSPGLDLLWGTLDDDYGNLHLGPSSPAIDSARSDGVPQDQFDLDNDGNTTEALPWDLDRNPRFVDDPNAPNTGPGSPPHVDRGAYENNLSTAAWTNPGGGSFIVPGNWQGGVIPNANTRAFFDDRVGSTQTSYEVTFPSAQTAYATNILANQVTFDLAGVGASCTQAAPLGDPNPGFLIGDAAGLSPSLRVRSSAASGAARALVFGNGVIANSPGSAGSLILNSQRGSIVSSGLLDIGRGGAGNVTMSNRALALTSGVRLGVQQGASGSLSITGLPPFATELDYDADFIVGDAGSGLVTVSNLGNLIGAAADQVVLGRLAGSSGTVTLTGAGTLWDATGTSFLIGESGAGILNINSGASLVTTISDQLILAKNPGSSALVTIGTGSSWTSTRALTVANIGGGSATLNIAGTLDVPGLTINPEGVLAGSGTVATSGVAFNAGQVRPQGASPTTFGTLTVQGGYEQVRPNVGGSASGQLHLKVAGSTPGVDQDKFVVTGTAQFGGGLFITTPNFDPPQGFNPQLISATTRTRNFDVALFPGLSNNRFFRLDYPRDGSVNLGIGSLDGPINFGNPINSQTLRPSAIALGDIDNDGDPDLALAVPDANPSNPGSVVILRNGGNTGGVWNGFTGQITILSGVGRNPQGIALGNFDGVNGTGNGKALDIAVSNFGDNTATIIMNNGGGTVGSFNALSPIAVGPEPVGVAAGRLLQAPGGLDDVVVANSGATGAGANTVTVLANMGNTVILPTPVPIGPRPTSARIANIAGNGGQLDIVTSNLGNNTVSIRLGSAQPPGTWTGPDLPTGGNPTLVLTPDLSGDGLPEIVTVDEADGTISVLVNTAATLGPGTFTPRVALPVGTSPVSATALDMDQDGDPDLAVVVDGAVTVLRNDLTNGQIAFAPAASPPAGSGVPIIVDHADVNTDNREDLVTITTGPRNVGAFAGANPNQTQGACFANCDGSTGTPRLTPNDFACFLNAYATGNAAANCDGSTGTPVLTPNDFLCFLNAYAAGCP